MKIAIASINYAPELTGIAVYSAGMAEHLAAAGHAVTVHTAFPYYPAWKKRDEDRGRLHARELNNGVSVRRNYLYVPAKPSALGRILHEASFIVSALISFACSRRPDCVVVVLPPLGLALAITLIARLKRTPVFLHVQDLQPDTALELGMLRPGFFASAMLGLERWSYRLADRVTTIGEGMRRRIVAKGVPPQKVGIFRNWANDQQIVPLSRETSFRRDWGLEGKFVVLYSGNMGFKQGLPVLLEAAERVQSYGDIVFVIVGDGGEKESLIAQAQRLRLANVMFQPLQPGERLGELLATADVSVIPQKKAVVDLVLPSKLGNVLASGRPVVAAATPESELAELVTRNDCGIVVPPDDPEALAAGVLALYQDSARRERQGFLARQVVETRLSQQVILDRFAEELSGSLGSGA